MAKRNNRSDFDDFDDFSGSEERYTPKSTYTDTSSGDDEDWAGGSRRRTERRSRSSSRSGGKGKLWLIAIPLVCVVVIAALVMGLGGSDSPKEVHNHKPSATEPSETQNAPDDPQVTVPPVVQPQDPQPTAPPETTPPVVEPPAVEPVRYGFYGRLLSAEQQEVYDQVYRAIRDYESETAGLILTRYEDLGPAVDAVFLDHAELFWFRGGYSTSYFTMEGYVEITITYNYEYPKEVGLQHKAFVEEATRDILAQLQGKSEYEKVRGVYDFLIDRTIYDLAYKGTTIYELLYNSRAVCEGYARATQYLLDNLGVEVIYVSGEAGSPGDTEGHAWNIVNVEGSYYQLDTTWGDPVSDDGTQSRNYNYFLVTDEEMNRDHYPERYDLPACSATACNYYQRESNYLVNYDPQILAIWLTGAANQDVPLEFKCASKQVYDQTMQSLFDNDEIWKIMEQALGTTYSINYSYNDTMYIITIRVEW